MPDSQTQSYSSVKAALNAFNASLASANTSADNVTTSLGTVYDAVHGTEAKNYSDGILAKVESTKNKLDDTQQSGD